MDYSKIIFVTKTDTSRGPLAAAILRKRMPIDPEKIQSRGMVVLFPEPMNPKTVAVAAAKGIDIKDYVSVQLEAEDFGKDVLVLVLDDSYKQTVYDEYTEAVNVYTLKEFINESGSIADPYGGELVDYGKLYENLDDLIKKLVYKLRSQGN